MGNRTGKRPLIILGIIFIALLAAVLWSINRVGGYVASLNIPRAFVCKEIQKNVTPVPLTGKLYPDEKHVCIWFEYERAKNGDKIKVRCYRNGQLITEQETVLTSKKGIRAYYLIKSDGTSLPIGNYKVTLSSATKEWHSYNFEVVQKPVEVKQKASKIKAGGAKIAKNKKNSRKQQRRNSRRNRR